MLDGEGHGAGRCIHFSGSYIASRHVREPMLESAFSADFPVSHLHEKIKAMGSKSDLA